ncbi:hypothetical protein SLS60_009173 [Paraconiothyrium brasiliense]|uniref:Peptidase S8/S53 domain-containing protein n=1 Tax=Paraconiothyrium brasiliense TaxID=300254 RepID=A0ABR3QWJ1_9PLEO
MNETEERPESELPGKDTDLTIETSTALKNATIRLLRPSETVRDRRDFYAHYQFYLTEVIELVRRIQQTAHPDNHLILRVLTIHETFFDETQMKTTDRGSLPYCRAFNNLWKRWQDQPNEAVSRLLQQSLNVANAEQRKQHLRALEEWLKEVKGKYPDDNLAAPLNDFDVKNVKASSFSHNVSWAAHSLHKAFKSANDCCCKRFHEFEARICLRSHQEKVSDISGEFDMFLAFEDKWQEAHVNISENDGPTVHTKGTRVRFQSSHAQYQARQHNVPTRKRIVRLCADVKKMSAGSKCLNMDVDMDQLWKLASSECRYRIDQRRPPISLRQFISDHSDSLTSKTKGIIAILVSRSVLHFHGTPWIQRDWDSSKIFFYHKAQDIYAKSYIPVKPYMQTHLWDIACCTDDLHVNDVEQPDITETEQSDAELEMDPDDLVRHQCPLLVALAIILLELYFGKPYAFLAKVCGMSISEEEDCNTGWDSAVSVFHRFKSEISEVSSFRGAIESCLRPPLWEDDEGRKLDSQALRQRIYEEIVVPLEMELTKGFSYIKIDKLDYEAERIGLDRWGERIPDHGRGFPVDNAQNEETSPKYSDRKAQLSSVMHRKRTQAVVHEHNSYKRIRVTGSSDLRGQFFDDITPSEGYTRTQLDAYADWKAEFRGVYDKFITKKVGSSPSGSPVKIAVLDTGTNLDHPLLEAYEDQIKKCHSWTGTGSSDDVTDHLGHGTHVAGLLLYYCPHAELYIAKVADKCEPKPKVVAKVFTLNIKRLPLDSDKFFRL